MRIRDVQDKMRMRGGLQDIDEDWRREFQDKMRMRGGLQGIDEDKRRNVQDKMRMRGAVLWSQSNLDQLRLRLWFKKNPYKLSKKSSFEN